jgi:hypothetical protein
MIKAAKTLERHPEGILADFRHGITNAFVEGMNSMIQDIKSAARGFAIMTTIALPFSSLAANSIYSHSVLRRTEKSKSFLSRLLKDLFPFYS